MILALKNSIKSRIEQFNPCTWAQNNTGEHLNWFKCLYPSPTDTHLSPDEKIEHSDESRVRIYHQFSSTLLVFSPVFYRFESNTTSDWLIRSCVTFNGS